MATATLTPVRSRTRQTTKMTEPPPYDASAAPRRPSPGPGMAQELLSSQLDAIDELLHRMDEKLAADGLDPGLEELLDAITGADDAPLTFTSLHRRVHAGSLTWLQVWQHPQDEAGGLALVKAVMLAQLQRSRALDLSGPRSSGR